MIQKRTSGTSQRTEYPGISSRKGVCGGAACIAGTRIPVWILARARELGATNRRLLRMYPDLTAKDLKNAWRYAHDHTDEIAKQVHANEAQ
jgi:uncharacterized protein (DUF433 family)